MPMCDGRCCVQIPKSDSQFGKFLELVLKNYTIQARI
jgi:hypothetical protein